MPVLTQLTASAINAASKLGRRRLLVLCYHDLREPGDFTSWLRVETTQIKEHLDALSGLGRFVGPNDLDRLEDLPGRGLHLLLTFDDGYLNNLKLGAAILEAANIPALFFVSTHHLVAGEAFWFDRIVTRVQSTRVKRLNLSPFGLREYTFHPADGARRWEDIQRLLTDVKRLGNPAEPRVARILEFMDQEYGSAAEVDDQRLRPLTSQELRQLANRRQMFFGSHGHRHELMPLLNDQDLVASVTQSKQILEHLVGQSIADIAYPNGDEDQRVRAACKEAGYHRGFTTAPQYVPRGVDQMRIPRLSVGGYDTTRDLITRVNALLAASVATDFAARVVGRWNVVSRVAFSTR
jgi:peptidoglycan/xylan/chitin deacetylase (PgdA/CDA1 family)